VHNLKNLDADLPKDKFVVLTGVSGSGKSSLAFDTIVAEGQRRYLECLSSYARRFLDQLERPDVDSIEGLPPTVVIDQRAGAPNPRSTLATITEIYDYLRVLFARAGVPHCPSCDVPIERQSPEQMVDRVTSAAAGKRAQILAPLVRARKGQHTEAFEAIRRAGLIRARVDGEMIDVTESPPKLVKNRAHTIEAVVDRIAVRPGIRPRLSESVDLALKLTGGSILVLIESQSGWDELPLSTQFCCPRCESSLAEIEPRTFSFNSPHGACAVCHGLGTRWLFQPDLVLPDRSRSWEEGAAVAWATLPQGGKDVASHNQQVRDWLARHQVDARAPLSAWPGELWVLFWSGEPPRDFPGLAAMLDRSFEQTKSESVRRALQAYREEVACSACQGSRLRSEARAVRVSGRTIRDVCACTAGDALRFFRTLSFEPPLDQIANPLVGEIRARLQFLCDVGLAYLPLGRASDSLSGGELERARLAAQLGSGLLGVCYVVDEPTAGLHAADTAQLIGTLRALVAAGSTAIVVEHDAAVIEAADWIIDLGPGAGPDGGAVVAAGSPERVSASPESITGRYVRRERHLPPEPGPRLLQTAGWIELRGIHMHNLKDIDVRIPLGGLTCVTGVSGSGKSTLVCDVLAPRVRRFLHRSGAGKSDPIEIAGLDAIAQLIEVDQAPIGRSPRSTPATATGVFDEVRRVFAATREARIRGYRPGRFSFNAREGWCEACEGLGHRRIPMHFLPDLFITCEECQGKRYNQPTLEVVFKGKSIGDVLEMRVDEARVLFQSIPKVLRGLDALHEVGLGYMTLGQSSTTLSGGEAQRVKLAAELGRSQAGRTLYLLDEPTTGLHFADIDGLLSVLNRLADLGHAVVVIEHHLDVIAQADWVIDLGPGAGEDGGSVVAMGPPCDLIRVAQSRTAEALRSQIPKQAARAKKA
jgi:excinuclease ABC subunit A